LEFDIVSPEADVEEGISFVVDVEMGRAREGMDCSVVVGSKRWGVGEEYLRAVRRVDRFWL
jgi:hypothetical protein